MQHDYAAVGHVTIDVMDDGSLRPGGTALYSALQAARLGRRTLIVTQGALGQIEEALEPFRDEIDLEVVPAEHTTTLISNGTGSARRQRMAAWAGVIPDGLKLDSAIVHLAPVARETPRRWRGVPSFIGMTPQGLAREWAAPDAAITLGRPDAAAEDLARSCNAVVLSEQERDSCSALIAAAREAGAVVAITAGADPNTLLMAGGRSATFDVPALDGELDDLGAGDVYAAAFFIALADGLAPADAARFAIAAAAVRMAGVGPEAIGDRAAIEARLAAVGASTE